MFLHFDSLKGYGYFRIASFNTSVYYLDLRAYKGISGLNRDFVMKKRERDVVSLESERFDDVNCLNRTDCGLESFVSDF